MSPELLQVVLVLGGVVAGWIARHNGVMAPTPTTPVPTVPVPAVPAIPVPTVPFPTSVGKGQVLSWLLAEANVDLPKFLAALAQASQPPRAA